MDSLQILSDELMVLGECQLAAEIDVALLPPPRIRFDNSEDVIFAKLVQAGHTDLAEKFVTAGPLKQFMQKQVGWIWDAVFSREVKEKLFVKMLKWFGKHVQAEIVRKADYFVSGKLQVLLDNLYQKYNWKPGQDMSSGIENDIEDQLREMPPKDFNEITSVVEDKGNYLDSINLMAGQKSRQFIRRLEELTEIEFGETVKGSSRTIKNGFGVEYGLRAKIADAGIISILITADALGKGTISILLARRVVYQKKFRFNTQTDFARVVGEHFKASEEKLMPILQKRLSSMRGMGPSKKDDQWKPVEEALERGERPGPEV